MELYGDEELANAAEQHRIQIPNGCRWSDVLSTTKDVGKALQGAFRRVEKASQHLHDALDDATQKDKARLPDNLLVSLIKQFVDGSNHPKIWTKDQLLVYCGSNCEQQ